MNIEIECSGCKKMLIQKSVFQQAGMGITIIEVKPCDNIDCCDCSKCEDVQELKNKVKQLQKEKANILKYIEGNGSTKPAQQESHELKGTKDKPKKNLMPTPDIKIGSTIIPGIKKDSAVGTKADYRKLKV